VFYLGGVSPPSPPRAGGGADSIWLAMPVTELAVAVYAAHTIVKYTKKLSFEKGQRL